MPVEKEAEPIPNVGLILDLKPIITKLRKNVIYARMVEAFGERIALSLLSDSCEDTDSFDYFIDALSVDLSEDEQNDPKFSWDNVADGFNDCAAELISYICFLPIYMRNSQVLDQGCYLKEQLSEYIFCLVSQSSTTVNYAEHKEKLKQSVRGTDKTRQGKNRENRRRINRQSPFRV